MGEARGIPAKGRGWARVAGLALVALVALVAAPVPRVSAQRRCQYAEWKCPERDGRGCCTTAPPEKPDRGRPAKPFLASVRFDSSPQGAVVTVDGENKGVTPWAGRLAPREYQVSFALDGYEIVDMAVRVKKASGEQATLVALAKRAAPAVATPVAPRPIAERDGSSLGEKPCPAGMVPVPGGTFLMGSPDGEGADDEHPQHEVTLRPYCIDRTEVTVKAYRQCVKARKCSSGGSASCSRSDDAKLQNHPVNCVTSDEAIKYCRWAGKRLPTEAEWEYAARGAQGRRFPWGDEAPGPTRLNACGAECSSENKMHSGDDGWESTAPVGSYPDGASPFGALDMAGNVWESVADFYGNYSPEGAVDPTGPARGAYRVVRGGGWKNGDSSLVRGAARLSDAASMRVYDVGFRCARGAR